VEKAIDVKESEGKRTIGKRRPIMRYNRDIKRHMKYAVIRFMPCAILQNPLLTAVTDGTKLKLSL
jgi:hypothetical protein